MSLLDLNGSAYFSVRLLTIASAGSWKSHLFKQLKTLLFYNEEEKKKKKEWLLQLSFILLFWMGPQRLVEMRKPCQLLQ